MIREQKEMHELNNKCEKEKEQRRRRKRTEERKKTMKNGK